MSSLDECLQVARDCGACPACGGRGCESCAFVGTVGTLSAAIEAWLARLVLHTPGISGSMLLRDLARQHPRVATGWTETMSTSEVSARYRLNGEEVIQVRRRERDEDEWTIAWYRSGRWRTHVMRIDRGAPQQGWISQQAMNPIRWIQAHADEILLEEGGWMLMGPVYRLPPPESEGPRE